MILRGLLRKKTFVGLVRRTLIQPRTTALKKTLTINKSGNLKKLAICIGVANIFSVT
jgi:hypothetical protein